MTCLTIHSDCEADEPLKVHCRRKLPVTTVARNDREVPSAARLGPRRRRGPNASNFGILGKGKRVFHIDPEIAHRILDLAMSEKDLNGTQVAGCPVDYRCLRSPKRVCAILASHQTDPCHPFIDKPGILAGAEMPIMINPAGKDIVVHRAAPPLKPSEQAGRASGSNSN